MTTLTKPNDKTWCWVRLDDGQTMPLFWDVEADVWRNKSEACDVVCGDAIVEEWQAIALPSWLLKAAEEVQMSPPDYIIAVFKGDIDINSEMSAEQLQSCIQWVQHAKAFMLTTPSEVVQEQPAVVPFCTFCDTNGHDRSDCPHVNTPAIAAPLMLETKCPHTGPIKVGRSGQRICCICNKELPAGKQAAGKFGF